MRKSGRQLFAGPYLIWIIGFILLPLAMIIYYAFTTSGGTFTFENVAAIADPVHVRSILLSLKLGIICTIVCLLLAYPLAMILNGLKIKQQNFVVFIFILPMWMNFMLRILASAVIQQRNCQCNLPVFWIWHRKNAQYTDCRCIWYGLRFSSVYDTANLQLHGKNQK